MLKLTDRCKVCVAVKKDKKLLDEIYNSSFFMKRGKSLMAIHSENTERFSYESLTNHCKKHQFMNENDFTERHLRQISKSAEKSILKRRIDASEVWDKVITEGMELLEQGELTMKTADLLKAAKDKSDFHLKTKDQEMAFAEMMYFFASGENQTNLRRPYDRRFVAGEAEENYDAAVTTPADSGTRPDRPGDIYYPPSWDALTLGASEVPPGNDQ